MSRTIVSVVHMKRTADQGFSLIEVAFGIGILGTALASLAPVLVQTTRQVAGAGQETRAVAAAASRAEQMSALPFEFSGGLMVPVDDATSDLSRWPPATGGTGLLPVSPVAAIQDAAGLVDGVTDAGVSVAPGDPRTRLVRRWAVSILPRSPVGNGVLVQVFSRAAAPEAQEPPRRTFGRRAGDVWLFGARARTWR